MTVVEGFFGGGGRGGGAQRIALGRVTNLSGGARSSRGTLTPFSFLAFFGALCFCLFDLLM